MSQIEDVAEKLAALYGQSFGGKASGRYRLPQKMLREMMGRRRLYEDDIRDLSRAVLEKGFVLIDMDSFYVVMSANSFVNYRRASKDSAEPGAKKRRAVKAAEVAV